MKPYLRAFLRHKVIVCIPVVLALLLGLGYEVKLPKQYTSTGTIWADTPVPQPSTVFGPAATSTASEASTLLGEFLRTDEFLHRVGGLSPWAGALRAHPAQLDALVAPVASHTAVAVVGPQVLSVAYTSGDPATDSQVTRAVMSAFLAEVFADQQQRAQQQVAYDTQSLRTAGVALASAKSALSTYVTGHPGADTTDPTVTQLSGAVTTADQVFGTASSDLTNSQLLLSHATDPSQLHLIDQPGQPVAKSNKKKIIFAGVGGLFGGGAISVVLLSWLVARDTSVRDADEIEDLLGLRVVGTVEDAGRGRRRSRRAS